MRCLTVVKYAAGVPPSNMRERLQAANRTVFVVRAAGQARVQRPRSLAKRRAQCFRCENGFVLSVRALRAPQTTIFTRKWRTTSMTMRRLTVVKYAESVPLANVGE